jgi:hypothetical protein
MPLPWRFWYHCVGNTYGTWAYGDPRGFRTWRHREHVEGDYRHPPPPDAYQYLYEQTLASMTRDAVLLEPPERELVCRAMGERLDRMALPWVDLAVTQTHYHLLARFEPREILDLQSRGMAIPRLSKANALQDGRNPWPRHLVGILKKHAAHVHRERAPTSRPGGLWAKRAHIIPIDCREHAVAVAWYIRQHLREGGVVYSVLTGRDPVDRLRT